MTIEAYRIAANVVLGGDAAAQVGALSRQFEALDRIIKGVQRSAEGLASTFAGIGQAGKVAADAWNSAAMAMERAARAAGAGGGRSMLFLPPASGGGGGGGGPAFLALPPPGGGGGGGMPMTGYGRGGRSPKPSAMRTLAEAGAEYYASREAMQEDVALRAALMSMGFRPSDPDWNAGLGSLQRLASSAAFGTIFTEQRTAGAMPGAAGVLGFGGSDPAGRAEAIKKFAAIFPTVLRLGEVAEMLHMGGVEDAMTAAISYAHMTNRYDPTKLEPGLDRLLNVARMTHESVSGEASVLKYSVPIAQAAGINADDAATLTGFLQILGFSGTTAGTGLGQLISGLAPINITRHGANAKAKALQALGLMDASGKISEGVAPGGHVDVMALLRQIAAYASAHKPTDVLATFREAFTVRGMRVAGAMENEEAIPRLLTYIQQIGRLPGARETQAALAESPMQSFEQMLARFADTGNTIATQTLPGLKSGFEAMTTTLEGVNSAMKSDPGSTGAAGYGLLGLIGANALSLGAKGLNGLGMWGAGRAATIGAGALRTAGGLGLLFGLAGIVADTLEGIDKWAIEKMWGKGAWSLVNGGPNAIGDARAAVPVKITDNGPDGLAYQIAAAVKDAIKSLSITIDGKRVSQIVAGHVAQDLSRPPTGSTTPDLRMTPFYAPMGIVYP